MSKSEKNEDNLPALKVRGMPAEQRTRIVDEALERSEHGEKLADVALSIGLKESSLCRLMMKERPDEWREVQSARAAQRLETANTSLETAKDGLELARAEKMGRIAMWELERLKPGIYGPKQEPEKGQGVTITINLGGEPLTIKSEPKPIEGEATRLPDDDKKAG